MFHSYVSLPEGIIIYLYCWMWGYRYESTNQWRKEHLWFGQLPDNYHWLVLSWMKQHQWLILFPRSNNRPVMGNQSSNTDFAEMSYGFIVFIVWWSNVIHITLFRVFFLRTLIVVVSCFCFCRSLRFDISTIVGCRWPSKDLCHHFFPSFSFQTCGKR